MTSTALQLPLVWLDVLWLQVTGTRCNIACRHCFIDCGPKSTTHGLMSVEQVESALVEAAAQGVRAIWFTGGEPFLHPRILDLIDRAMEVGPLGILTNGMLVDGALAEALAERFRRGPYNLEIRVSLDGATPDANDAIRGRGVFARTTEGIAHLARAGLPVVVAVSLLEPGQGDRAAFLELLRGLGVERPRIRWIPPFRIGREERRGRSYLRWERLTAEQLADPETPHRLQCGTSRTVTAEGVWPCPILINEPAYRLGDRLEEAMGAHRIDHPACHTCYVEGFSCSN